MRFYFWEDLVDITSTKRIPEKNMEIPFKAGGLTNCVLYGLFGLILFLIDYLLHLNFRLF